MPKNLLKGFDPKYLRIIREFGKEAAAQNIPAYLVGGVVRDIILGKGNLDLDMVLEGDAGQFAKGFAKRHKVNFVVHPQFGTATIFLPGGPRLDLSTARKEVYPFPGALPEVSSGTIRDDLFRRDFTINALALSINPEGFGKMADFYRGQADLKNRLIRVLHDKSFIDDPTRILRAVRFEQRFNFHIEKRTLGRLRSALRQRAFAAVKPERYFQEFRKFLNEPSPGKCLRRLSQLNGFGFLGKDFKYSSAAEKIIEVVEKKVNRRPIQSEFKEVNISTIYFMAFFDRMSPRRLNAILSHFNFRREERKDLLSVSQILKSGSALKRKDLRPSQVYEILKPYSKAAILFLKIKNPNRIAARHIDRFLKKDALVTLDVNGHDLSRLGFQSGKELGNALHELLCEKLDGHLRSRQEELKRAAQLLK